MKKGDVSAIPFSTYSSLFWGRLLHIFCVLVVSGFSIGLGGLLGLEGAFCWSKLVLSLVGFTLWLGSEV